MELLAFFVGIVFQCVRVAKLGNVTKKTIEKEIVLHGKGNCSSSSSCRQLEFQNDKVDHSLLLLSLFPFRFRNPFYPIFGTLNNHNIGCACQGQGARGYNCQICTNITIGSIFQIQTAILSLLTTTRETPWFHVAWQIHVLQHRASGVDYMRKTGFCQLLICCCQRQARMRLTTSLTQSHYTFTVTLPDTVFLVQLW